MDEDDETTGSMSSTTGLQAHSKTAKAERTRGPDSLRGVVAGSRRMLNEHVSVEGFFFKYYWKFMLKSGTEN